MPFHNSYKRQPTDEQLDDLRRRWVEGNPSSMLVLHPNEKFIPIRVPQAGNPDRAMIYGLIEAVPARGIVALQFFIPVAIFLGFLAVASIVMFAAQFLFQHVRITWLG